MSFTFILIYVLIALLTCFYYVIRKQLNYWQALGIPCEEPVFLFGNLKGLRTKISFNDVWTRYYKKFKGTGPFAGFYWFQNASAFVLEPSLAKLILIKDFNKFTDRGFFSNERDDPLSGQLFLLDGHKWRRMRNKLSPTFTSGKMKYMFPTVVGVCKEFVRIFGEELNSNPIIEVRDVLGRFTTDVIGTCAFGIDCNSLKNPDAEFRIMGKRTVTHQRHGPLGLAFLNGFPNLSRFLHMKQTPDDIEEFYMRIVKETVAEREKHNIRRNDFMDMLIDLKNNKSMKDESNNELASITIEELAAQAFVFLVAGFETSSTTMSFALYELAQHEDIQQKVRDEINTVLQRHNGELSYECMKEMIYVDQVIAETLRLYTVLPILNRVALEDYVVPDNPKYVLKKGTKIFIPIGPMHRDAAYYPNPNEFNPDNFAPELVRERDCVEWMPFGEGPRNCIGLRFGKMQARVGLALLLKNFKFSVCSKTQIPIKYDKKSFLISPESGIYLKVEKVIN